MQHLLLLLLILALLSPTWSVVELTGFTLDMHYGLLTLMFSETMQSKYFNSSKVILQSGADSTASGVTSIRLDNNLYTQIYNATSMYISLSPSYYSTLSLDSDFGSSATNTFVRIDENCR